MSGHSAAIKAVVLLGFAALTHAVVVLIRYGAGRVVSGWLVRHRKARSIISLATSALVFVIYFVVLGLVLREMGISLTAYLASASVIGLAVAFGSQGVVQDVVTGLTIIFSDLLDVDDLVEIGGQTGKVRGISMRFVELENALGARVFIPNRTINNVINYPKGYVRCLVDVTLTGDDATKDRMAEAAEDRMRTIFEQFPGILLTSPSVEGREKVTGKEFLRIKFRIWPNRGQPIETVFVKELGTRLRELEPGYQDWMIAVFYEVEQRTRTRKTKTA